MTKETLKGFGLTDEQTEKVWSGLDGNYVTKSRFNEVIEEKKQLRESLKERDEQLETLKTASGAADKLKEQIAELQAANTKKDTEHAAELKQVRRENLDERLLAEAKAINPLACRPFLPAIDASAEDEGYAALRKQQIEGLTKAESTKFLFSAQTPTLTGMKPGESGDGGQSHMGATNPFATDTYDEAEQMKMYRESPDVAKALMKQAGLSVI